VSNSAMHIATDTIASPTLQGRWQ